MRRAYRNYVGVKVTRARTIGYTIFYFVFGAFFVAVSFFEGVSLLYSIPDALFLAVAAVGSYRFADRRISFWKTSDGSVYYKGGIIIYFIYVIGLVARIGIELVLIGPSAFTFVPGETLSQTAILGTTITDMLLTFGIGLLVGRNIRVYRRYNLIEEGKDSITTS